jgi:DNA processing protein
VTGTACGEPATADEAASRPAAEVARTGAALALAALPGMTRLRMRALLDAWLDPRTAVERVAAGRAAPALIGLRESAPVDEWPRALDVERCTELARRRGTTALLRQDPGFPMDELQATCPPVVFAEGLLDCLERPRVSIVGTRAATPHGIADARELATDLAARGVTVISGMAIGIDGAAHLGALDAGCPTVGVIATGLDRCYPRRHTALHARVREHGLLVTEQPFGTLPAAHRFPTRNDVIAALAHVVVLVEATITGGAMITARAAAKIGTTVLAIPGSRRNPGAAGCNDLIQSGHAGVLLSVDDVLMALSMSPGARVRTSSPPPAGDPARVFAAFGGEPATADQLAARTGLDVGVLMLAIDALARSGHLRRERGWLWPMEVEP